VPPSASRPTPARRSRIPAGRLERFARLGWLAGEVALGGVTEAARRLTGAGNAASSVFLSTANARKLAERLSRMRGAAMKLGQLLSLEGQDLLPPEVGQALSILRSEADAMPESQLRRVLSRAWGKGWERRFRSFGMEPIAAASIGQVHHAVTTDGRELALKIQYPGVARSIESDVDNLAAILRLSRLLPGELDLSAILAEAKRQLREETDYHAEARHLRTYAALVAAEPDAVVPKVHDDLSTGHILAMDYLAGEPLDALASRAHPQRERDRVGTLLYRVMLRELLEWRVMQTDPNFANYLLLADRRIALLDYGATRPISAPLSAQYARMLGAGMRRDRDALRAVLIDIGFFDASERPDRAEGVVDLFLIGCEPFNHRGAFDFGASDIPARARELGTDLTLRRGFLRPPPPATIFLHRKLGGTFLLCNRIGARVDVQRLFAAIRPTL
jgi:predicted unusual protein kinase regulating ubiquinone biosynthesis (AarF/ABC1/UbiB family)